MTEMFLLGAGASVEGGVPNAVDMTDRMVAHLSKGAHRSTLARVLSFVLGGLALGRGIDGEDPRAGLNVEEVFSAVKMLADRASLEAAPFIGSWHPAIAKLEKPNESPFAVSNFVDAIFKGVAKGIANRHSNGFDWHEKNSLERALREIMGQREWSPFSLLADEMIKALVGICWIEPERGPDFSYLQPILDLQRDRARVAIATLNYDNGFEQLCASKAVPCDTGIGAMIEGDDWDTRLYGTYLLKLHGSIDWMLRERREDHLMPAERLQLVDEEVRQRGYQPAVIFGQRDKLTVRGPFIRLLEQFSVELSRCDHLVVVGYSFRDDHVNENITRWLNRSLTNRLTVVDPSFPQPDSKYAQELHRHCSDRIVHVEKFTGEGLEEVVAGCLKSTYAINDLRRGYDSSLLTSHFRYGALIHQRTAEAIVEALKAPLETDEFDQDNSERQDVLIARLYSEYASLIESIGSLAWALRNRERQGLTIDALLHCTSDDLGELFRAVRDAESTIDEVLRLPPPAELSTALRVAGIGQSELECKGLYEECQSHLEKAAATYVEDDFLVPMVKAKASAGWTIVNDADDPNRFSVLLYALGSDYESYSRKPILEASFTRSAEEIEKYRNNIVVATRWLFGLAGLAKVLCDAGALYAPDLGPVHATPEP